MQESDISWCDATWNPVHGCSRVSAGCQNCYAEKISRRFGHTEHPWTAENAEENVTLKPDKLDEPYGWGEPAYIFVNSMSDLFHSKVPDGFIEDVFAVMRNCPEHVFQVLTKRPGRAAHMDLHWPENVWVGTSVEDERVTDRIGLLRECPAHTRFISFEPLIGPVGDIDLRGYDWVIVGGESAPDEDRREMEHEWVWPIAQEALERGVDFYFKQSSAPYPERGKELRCPDGEYREFREIPDPHPMVERAREERV